VHEYQNALAESPLGQAFSTSGTTANASIGPSQMNTNELAFGAAVFVGGNGTAGDGFTQQLELSGNITEDKLIATPVRSP
jgi:hypothetical protein